MLCRVEQLSAARFEYADEHLTAALRGSHASATVGPPDHHDHDASDLSRVATGNLAQPDLRLPRRGLLPVPLARWASWADSEPESLGRAAAHQWCGPAWRAGPISDPEYLGTYIPRWATLLGNEPIPAIEALHLLRHRWLGRTNMHAARCNADGERSPQSHHWRHSSARPAVLACLPTHVGAVGIALGVVHALCGRHVRFECP